MRGRGAPGCRCCGLLPPAEGARDGRVHQQVSGEANFSGICDVSVSSSVFSYTLYTLSQAAAVSPERGERWRRAARRAAVRPDGLPLLPRLHQPAARAGQDPTAVHPAGRYEHT